MIRLLVPGLAEAADVGTVRRLVRARRSERSARQSESVKGEPRFRRRPRRRPLSASPWLERWACRPSSPPTCATVRLASATPIASNGSRLTASSPYALSSSPLSSPSWPSSPYCPPSHDEMAISEQCNRESSALRSDYYSTTKKTANPLNEWWTTMERRAARSACRIVRPRVPSACDGVCRASRSQFCPYQRNPDGTGVSSMVTRVCRQSLCARPCRRHRGAMTPRSAARPAVRRAKKFSTGRLDRRCADQKSRREERISAK
jgi:hypothetical protein